jgi:hypothetical protein
MKRFLFLLCCTLLTLSLVTASAADAKKKTKAPKAGRRGVITHVVSLKFKPEATPAQIKEVEDAFRALKDKIPEVVSLDWGTNVSPEKLNKDFTHAWVLTFKTEADRDAYLVAPAHKEFGKLLGPVLADVFVIDFAAQH